MKRTKIKNLPKKDTEKAGDDTVRRLYSVKSYFVGPTYLSTIDNGDQNILVRLTFAEPMMLNNNRIEHSPVSSVTMNIVDFQKFYNLATMQLQMLREQKKIP